MRGPFSPIFEFSAEVVGTARTQDRDQHWLLSRHAMRLYFAGDRDAVLINCTSDEKTEALKAELSKMKREVKAILLTHGHGDHVVGCQAFPSAKVYALEEDRALAEKHSPAKGLLTRWSRNDSSKMHRVDVALQSGENLPFKDVEVQACAVPGHTAVSAAFLSKGGLFFGDSVSATKEGTLREAPGMYTDDSKQCRKSVQALGRQLKANSVPVSMLAFAHSCALPGRQALDDF